MIQIKFTRVNKNLAAALLIRIQNSGSSGVVYEFSGLLFERGCCRVACLKIILKKTGEKLSFAAYIARCPAQVIKDYPHLNSFIKGKRFTIIDDVTISVFIEREIVGENLPEPKGTKQHNQRLFSNAK
ncbi:hypothetical protein JXJ21_21465 [candidate division KSB1 bacterium]|nr:hypothetical protein [candidate division KSB1 bacterium]